MAYVGLPDLLWIHRRAAVLFLLTKNNSNFWLWKLVQVQLRILKTTYCCKKEFVSFFKEQWMHFTGEVYKSKTAYVSISILYTRNYFDWLIFDWVIQEKNKVAFLRHCAQYLSVNLLPCLQESLATCVKATDTGEISRMLKHCIIFYSTHQHLGLSD